jgi:diacylglycerol kinase (ATP)
MSKLVRAIINPVSGRRSMLPVVQETARLLAERGGELDIQLTTCAGHATELAAEAPPGTEAILAVGGDGTVCEVVNGLIERPLPIVILGTGTENLMAKFFRMPKTPADIVDTLLTGVPQPSDVGVVNGKHFLAVGGVGFDAEVVHRLVGLRTGHIDYLSYFWPIWRTLWGHPFPRLEVVVDGQRVFDQRGLIIMGVISRYSLGLRIMQHAECDDGLLDICCFPCTSQVTLGWYALNVLRGTHDNLPGVVYRQGRNIEITTPDHAYYEIDGEFGGELPAHFTMLPQAATLLRPAPQHS